MRRIRSILPAAVGLVVFAIIFDTLRVELHAIRWQDVARDIRAIPQLRVALAILLTALSYIALSAYDLLAFATIDTRFPRLRIAGVSMLSYAVSHTAGAAAVSGATVRYRFYSRWGLSAGDFSRLVVAYSVTFWLGLMALGGASLLVSPLPLKPGWPSHAVQITIGVLLLIAVATYLVLTAVRRAPLRLGRFDLRLPRPVIGLTQLLLSSAEWALAAAVLYVLLPSTGVSFTAFLAAFLIAMLLGLASHIPGGLGVFDGALAVMLAPHLTPTTLAPALVVYRVIYFLLPFAGAAIALLVDALMQRGADAQRLTSGLGRLTRRATPRVLAILTFVAGIVLLVSGATPAEPERLALVGNWIPVLVIEASHFNASVLGALLLLLSQGLSRRLDAAFYLTCIALCGGIALSLLKGLDYEEAITLAVVLVFLIRARPLFTRRAALFATRFSPVWAATVLMALAATVWLGMFSFRHVDYSQELWWRFELHAEASRALRASVGAAIVVLLFGFARLVRHAPHVVDFPTDPDLDDAAQIIRGQSSTQPNLAFLRDKGLLFNDDRTAFIMYGVQGRTWVAMGDPVGPADAVPDMVASFLAKCDDFGGVPVFYEASTAYLPCYLDFGMAFMKIGEEARVDLRSLDWSGGKKARLRQALKRLDKEGSTFRVLEPAEVVRAMPDLRSVSDEWKENKAVAEKGFSLGFFDEDYLARFPVAVVEREGRILAFANLWTAGDRDELSIDLMRFRRSAPTSIMETLLAHLLQWAQAQGYRSFSMGMAPLSGIRTSAVASTWLRLASLVYQHGEPLFNFQGLRAFKEKFDPAWLPRYVVYPGGMTLPRVLTAISALVAGGYRRIFVRRNESGNDARSDSRRRSETGGLHPERPRA